MLAEDASTKLKYYLHLHELSCWQLEEDVIERKDFDIRKFVESNPCSYEIVNIEAKNNMVEV